MALKDADLFVVADSAAAGTNKKVRADALATFITGGANVQSVEGGDGITATTAAGAVTVSANINTSAGLTFTGNPGDPQEIAVNLGAGLAFNPANGSIEVTSQALNFAGQVDLTQGGTIPAGAVAVGDAYVNNGNGAAAAEWAAITTDLDANDPVVGTDLVICTTAGVGAAARYVFVHTGGGAGTVDIAQGVRTAVDVPITNTGGTDATLTAATTTLAGVMTATDKAKLDDITIGDDGFGNDIVTNIKVDLSTAVTATTNTVECDKGTDAILNGAVASTGAGVGGSAGLLIATDKQKLDGIGAGATIVSVTAQNGVKNEGTATEPILEANFGAVGSGTPTTVMPYDISLLADI